MSFRAQSTPLARAVAFYLPQFHPIPENDAVVGPGFTEWTNAGQGAAALPGSLPAAPAGGSGLLRPALARDTGGPGGPRASSYGIEAFCYWHYWFDGRRHSRASVQGGARAAASPTSRSVSPGRTRPGAAIWHGAADRVLIEQTYPGSEDDRRHFDAVLPAFSDPRYLRVDGKPLFYVFRPELHPEPAAFVERWQAMATQAGLDGLYLVAEVSDLLGQGPKYVDVHRDGFDAGVYIRLPARADPRAVLKMRAARKLLRWPERYRYENEPIQPPTEWSGQHLHPCVYPNWDNTPRSGRQGLVLTGSSPEAFRRHVRVALDAIQSRPASERLLFIKSWNEWAEGNYLEPDLEHGHGFLRALGEELAGHVHGHD